MLFARGLSRRPLPPLSPNAARGMCGLPYRIRAPLARLKEKKSRAESGEEAAVRPGGLGDGEKLESNATNPDYVRLALTATDERIDAAAQRLSRR